MRGGGEQGSAARSLGQVVGGDDGSGSTRCRWWRLFLAMLLSFCFRGDNDYSQGIPGMWPNPPHATNNDAEEISSYHGSKVVASNDDGDGSDGFIDNMFCSIATPLLPCVSSCNCTFCYLFRIPHHAPGRLFEGVSCPSASGRDLTRVKNQNLQLRNWGVQ